MWLLFSICNGEKNMTWTTYWSGPLLKSLWNIYLYQYYAGNSRYNIYVLVLKNVILTHLQIYTNMDKYYP